MQTMVNQLKEESNEQQIMINHQPAASHGQSAEGRE
jgi:hypothetical protein